MYEAIKGYALPAGRECEPPQALTVQQSIKDRAFSAMQSAAELRERMDQLSTRSGVNGPRVDEKSNSVPRPVPDTLMQTVNELNDVLRDAHNIMARLDTIA
jgi:hypothetical protein